MGGILTREKARGAMEREIYRHTDGVTKGQKDEKLKLPTNRLRRRRVPFRHTSSILVENKATRKHNLKKHTFCRYEKIFTSTANVR